MEYIIGALVGIFISRIWRGRDDMDSDQTLKTVQRIERILRVIQRRNNINDTEQSYIDGDSSSL